MKIKTIALTFIGQMLTPSAPGGTSEGWRIDQVTDSTEYTPGTYLSKSEVDYLCESQHWKVTIKANPRCQ